MAPSAKDEGEAPDEGSPGGAGQDEPGEGGADDLTLSPQKLRGRRLLAALLVLTFAAMALGGLARLWQQPSLEQLWEAQLPPRDPLVQRQGAAVVALRVLRPDGLTTAGTGFNVAADGIIVTNRHVVDAGRLVTVTFADGSLYGGRQIYVARGPDLAVVTLERDALPYVELPTEAPRPAAGAPVTIIGNPLGMAGVAVAGRLRRGPTLSPYWEVEAPIQHGHSGSPVFTADGRLAGIIFALAAGDRPTGLAVPTADILTFLDELAAAEKIPPLTVSPAAAD